MAPYTGLVIVGLLGICYVIGLIGLLMFVSGGLLLIFFPTVGPTVGIWISALGLAFMAVRWIAWRKIEKIEQKKEERWRREREELDRNLTYINKPKP